jgi:hypothetical protein
MARYIVVCQHCGGFHECDAPPRPTYSIGLTDGQGLLWAIPARPCGDCPTADIRMAPAARARMRNDFDREWRARLLEHNEA